MFVVLTIDPSRRPTYLPLPHTNSPSQVPKPPSLSSSHVPAYFRLHDWAATPITRVWGIDFLERKSKPPEQFSNVGIVSWRRHGWLPTGYIRCMGKKSSRMNLSFDGSDGKGKCRRREVEVR
jgi:hypothetical protein